MTKSPNHALMSAVADELADVRAGIESLSGLVSELLPHCPAELRAEALTRAQAFDELTQRLEGLSGIASALGAGQQAQAALDSLTLTALSDRLAGSRRPTTDATAAGDLVLFD